MRGVLERVVPAKLGSSFRWLLASSWASNLADGLFVAAGPLLVASLTDSPFLIAMAALLRWAPQLAFGLYAGLLADRLNRLTIVLVGNAVRVLVLAALVTLLLTGRLTAMAALVAFGLLSTAEVFSDSTTGTMTPMIVARDDLATANARIFFGFGTVNQLIGPAVGATLFALGRAWPFAGQAVLILATLHLLSRVRLPPHGRDKGAGTRSMRRDLVEGMRWAMHHAAVRTLILIILIFNITFGAAWSILVLYAERRLGLDSIGFGLLTTVSAMGGLLATATYGAITRRVSLGNLMRIGLIIETLTHLALAVTTIAWIAFVIFFVFGAHAFVWGTTSATIRQRAIPSDLMGRVNSINTVASYGGLVVGSAIGGVVATRFDVTAPFWFAFAGSALFVVLVWRQLSHVAHADAEPRVAAATGAG